MSKIKAINRILTLAMLAMVATWAGATPPKAKFAVSKINFDHVKEVTQNPSNAYYFPKLVRSFQSNDTTMSFEAYRNFYYGYTFQEDYDPFRESVYSDKVEHLYYKQPHSRAECDSIEKYAQKSLDDNPFDLDQMKYFIYVLKEEKKWARASIRQYRLDHLIAAIMSSGKGTKEEPWVVIMPEHEYNIINFLGFEATGHQDEGNGIDYIAVKPKDDKDTKGFYFDVSRLLQVAAVKFPDKE